MAMRCARHPDVETGLTCGKCGTPICPRCMVQTPVGARCRDCAQLRRLPQYHISAAYLARGAGAGVVAGAVAGGLWGLVIPFGAGFLFGLLIGLGIGYAVGEAVSAATNRKAGPPLQALAVGGVLVAYVVRGVIIVSGYRGIEFNEILTEDLLGWVTVGIAAFMAAGRVR